MNPEIDPFLIPPAIKTAYDIGTQDSVSRLSGGLVNETLLVEQGEHKFVLRKLAPILGVATVQNTCVISEHLARTGWEAPVITPSVTGELHAFDETGRLWHGMSYIPADTNPTCTYDVTLAELAGQLLGSWHLSVKSLHYSPDGLPHFHDTDYIARKLEHDAYYLTNPQALKLARWFLSENRHQTEFLPGEFQIIHGDPKLNNMLFRNGTPFTLIDFDCVMRESIWTDVGDFLRSISGKLVDTGQEVTDTVTGFVEGYLAGNESALSADEALYFAQHATKRITCELGMRYLSDLVDGQDYFSWDQAAYESRDEALYDRALLQYKVLQVINENLNEG